jgi:hypothetical protein
MKGTAALVSVLALLLGASASAVDGPGVQDPSEVAQRIESLQKALQQLQHELDELRAMAGIPPTPAPVVDEPVAPPLPPPPPPSTGLEKINLWGYGEVYYMHPKEQGQAIQEDLARAVFGIGYQFDEKTRFNSEFEVEHAVASAVDPGEFEVEQFYVDRILSHGVSLRAGLFLIPAGLLNEHHEPTNFFGVQRNFVETLIIPSTWREGGLSVEGVTDSGFTWDLGLTTGLTLGSWEFSPAASPYQTAFELETTDVAPMQASHQELAFADARHLSEFGALNYRGVPGLSLGSSVFTGGMAPVPGAPDDERVILFEGHARYQPGRFDLSAVYARGAFSHTAEANALFPGATNPLPSVFDGYYVQAGYTAWQKESLKVAPFARFEHYNMGAGYEGLAPGLMGPAPAPGFKAPHDSVFTAGANFYVHPGVVLKADYQSFSTNADFSRFDFSLGLSF